MESRDDKIIAALYRETRRRILEESVPRIERCLSMLSLQEIWHKPNAQTNSIGNLILHLCGNVTQWIGSGLGDKPDTRKRSTEFTANPRYSKAELMTLLAKLETIIDEAFTGLTEDELLRVRPVQAYEESGLSIVVHVIEHFSYHTGQIALYTKLLKNKDLQFYAGDDLDKTTVTQ